MKGAGYPESQKQEAKRMLLEQFDLLCKVEYGKLTVNVNKRAKMIEIIPEPHFRISEKT